MTRLLSVAIPDDLAAEVEELARTSGETKSEVVRGALRRHLQQERFAGLQRYGRRQAEALAIGPEDAEGMVDELRLKRR